MKKYICYILVMMVFTVITNGQSLHAVKATSPVPGKKNKQSCTADVKKAAWNKKAKTKQQTPSLLMVPVNDDACNAILVMVNGGTVTGDNLTATVQTNEVIPPDGSSCTANDGWCENPSQVDNSVWYKFVVPSSANIQASTCNGAGSFDTQLAIWKATDCNNFATYTFIGGNDDGANCVTTYTSLLQLGGLTPGDTLLLQLDGYLGDAGTFELEITSIAAPVNDQPCNATVVTVGGSAGIFSNVNALTDPGEDSITPPVSDCISNAGWCEAVPTINNSVWFTFTAPATGAVTISTCNSANPFDTQLALYEAVTCSDFSTYTLIAANDDGDTSLCPTSFDFYTSYLAVCGLTSGNTYYLLVDGYNGDAGDFDLELNSFNPTPPVVSAGTNTASSCPSAANGTASIIPNGGIAPYSYLWSNGYIGNVLIAGPGTYTVTVTDQCGSTATLSATITTVSSTLSITTGTTQHICDGTPVSLSATATGGTFADTTLSFFGYNLSSGDLIRFGLNNTATPTVISTGNPEAYYAGDLTPSGFFAIDDNTSELVQIELNTGIKSVLGKIGIKNGHTWTGMAWDPSSGVLYGLSTDGTVSTLYAINTGNATDSVISDLQGLPAGIWLACSPGGGLFSLDISTDSLYRIDAVNGLATGIGPVGFDASYAQGADFDDETGTLYLAAYNFGTSMGELYSTDTLSGSSTFIGNLADEVDAFTCLPYSAGQVYSYAWSPATGLSAVDVPDPSASPAATTTYTVTVTDGCGSTATATQEVTVSNVTVIITKTDVTVFGGSDGTATAAPSGGSSPYSFTWSNGGSTAGITNLAAGTYIVTVTDANGCSLTDSTVISQPTSIQELSQAGLSSMSITPNPSSGLISLEASLSDQSAVDLAVYSIQGKLLQSVSEPAGMKIKRAFDLSEYGKGHYFIRITTKKGSLNMPVMIQ